MIHLVTASSRTRYLRGCLSNEIILAASIFVDRYFMVDVVHCIVGAGFLTV